MAAVDPQLSQACRTSPETPQRVVVTLRQPASTERLRELEREGLSPVPFQATILQGELSCDSIHRLGTAVDILEIASDRELRAL